MGDGQKIDSPSRSTRSVQGQSRLLGPPAKSVLLSCIRGNGFILGLFGVVMLAFLFPQPGSRNGWLHPDLVGNFGIALILFLQGLSMPLENVKRGAGNWRLHAIIQVFTFVIFPIVGLGLAAAELAKRHHTYVILNAAPARRCAFCEHAS